MKIFVTANQQFGRFNAIKTYKRPFPSVEEMNFNLIKEWNSVVSPEDRVYVLGNFAWDPETAEMVVSQLNGDIIVVPGEHDKAIEELDEMKNNLINVKFREFDIEFISEIGVTVSYWPLSEWPLKSKGIPSVIGYPGSKYKSDHKKNIINCNCDLWDYKPIEISKILSLFKDKDIK